MKSLPKDFLVGSIPPLVTPFKNGEVDRDSYAEMVAYQAKEGSHGVLVNGTTSEPSTLTVQERNRQVDTAMQAAGKLPVVVGTGSQSLQETRILCEHAAKAGAAALLVVTPYYIKPPQRGMVKYFIEATKDLGLPWMIYHIPGRTAVSVTLDTVKEISDLDENFVGMKHASTDLGFVSASLDALGDGFRIFVGLEELSFPMMAIGAKGLMNAVGNLCPGKLASLCESVFAGEMDKARALHMDLLEVNQAIFYDTNPIPLKYMMKKMGIIAANEHRLPMAPATPELERRLDGVLDRAGLLPE